MNWFFTHESFFVVLLEVVGLVLVLAFLFWIGMIMIRWRSSHHCGVERGFRVTLRSAAFFTIIVSAYHYIIQYGRLVGLVVIENGGKDALPLCCSHNSFAIQSIPRVVSVQSGSSDDATILLSSAAARNSSATQLAFVGNVLGALRTVYRV